MQLVAGRTWAYLARNRKNRETNQPDDDYRQAAEAAFKALVWVEIGFEGLQNLAVNRASINWTSSVGHIVTDEERARGIMTGGKELYDDCLKDFAELRVERGVDDDIFAEHGLENLLEPFKP